MKFRKSGVLPLATSRVQTQSRAVIDNVKALKLNWYWWVRHFRVAGYSIKYARECWAARTNELGEPVRTFKVGQERFMEIKGMASTSLEQTRMDSKTVTKTKAGGSFEDDALQLPRSTLMNLGQDDLSDWDPNASSEEEGGDDGDSEAGASDRGNGPPPSDGPAPSRGGDVEDADGPPPSDDEAPQDSPAVSVPAASKRLFSKTAGSSAASHRTRAPSPARSIVQHTPKCKKEKVSSEVTEAPLPTPNGTRAPQLAGGAASASKGDAMDTGSEAKTAAEMRASVASCSAEFEESIDMWWMQDLMVDLVSTTLEEHKVF